MTNDLCLMFSCIQPPHDGQSPIWHLDLSYTRSEKHFTRKILKQYGGSARKNEMKDDFKRKFKTFV